MKNIILSRLGEEIETFLTKWTAGMERAGYLKDTTAKREDCIRSLELFMQPIHQWMVTCREIPSFGKLLQNNGHWANPLVEVAQRHRSRGVTAQMFFGCFKTFVHVLEEMILERDAPLSVQMECLHIIRRWSDAWETLGMGDWTDTTEREVVGRLKETNRNLTLGKNKYENILAATSDIVLVTDAEGVIIEANPAAHHYFGEGSLLGQFFWEPLGLEGRNLLEVRQYYCNYETHEINLFDESTFFNLRLIPLKQVSLASKGTMVLLTDISCLVRQRELLVRVVNDRTVALANIEKQFSSLFQSAGEGILLIDTDFRVIEANHRSYQTFGYREPGLLNLFCNEICHPSGSPTMQQVIRNLDEGEIWEGELLGKREGGQAFSMAVTINRVDLDIRTLFHVLVRDITRQKELEAGLKREKYRMEEMNITLCNVMKSIEFERLEQQTAIDRKVKNILLPTLDRLQKASIPEVGKGHLSLIRDQLLKLSHGMPPEADTHLKFLTPTEKKYVDLFKPDALRRRSPTLCFYPWKPFSLIAKRYVKNWE